jgi:hypothetical protein
LALLALALAGVGALVGELVVPQLLALAAEGAILELVQELPE